MNEMHDVVKSDSGVVGFFKNVFLGVMLLVVFAIALLFSFGAVVSRADDSYAPLPVDTHFSYVFEPEKDLAVYYDNSFLGSTDSYHFVVELDEPLPDGCRISGSHYTADGTYGGITFDYDESAGVWYTDYSRNIRDLVFVRVGMYVSGGVESSYTGTVYFSAGDYVIGSGMPKVPEPLVNQFIGVWGGLVDCISGLFPDISLFFYADDELTFAGVCAVIMAGVALILLVFNLVRSFLTMRG